MRGKTEAAMADGERKSLVWNIKKTLLTLSANELFQIAKLVGQVPGMDESRLESTDEEGCFEYINSFMTSKLLLELEDLGMAHLLDLKDVTNTVIQGRVADSQVHVADDVLHESPSNLQVDDTSVDANHANADDNPAVTSDNDATNVDNASTTHNTVTTATDTHDTELQKMLTSYEELSKRIMQYKLTPTPQSGPQSPVKARPMLQRNNPASTQSVSKQSTPVTHDKLVSLRELSYLHRRELKIQGGQIGDQGSDLGYNSVCRQMEEGLKEQFSDAEVVRAVLRVIKPGTFKDMLMSKDDLSVEELKAFLHSHLGEQSNTELFQELMCTKQKDNETPQQFLYRVIGLKQKIMLASRHADTDVKYSASTVQDVFLHTVYQGLGHKHDDVRRELKPLLGDTRVSDEVILKQMKKVMSDESERQRRLGPATRQRLTNVHSVQSDVNAVQCPTGKEEKKAKTDMIQQLTEKVEQLTNMVELMKQSIQTQTTGQVSYSGKGRGDRRRERPYGCDKCVEQNRPDCPHCFHCGEEGHRAVGCLKKPTRQGNWSRSLPRDKQ